MIWTVGRSLLASWNQPTSPTIRLL